MKKEWLQEYIFVENSQNIEYTDKWVITDEMQQVEDWIKNRAKLNVIKKGYPDIIYDLNDYIVTLSTKYWNETDWAQIGGYHKGHQGDPQYEWDTEYRMELKYYSMILKNEKGETFPCIIIGVTGERGDDLAFFQIVDYNNVENSKLEKILFDYDGAEFSNFEQSKNNIEKEMENIRDEYAEAELQYHREP